MLLQPNEISDLLLERANVQWDSSHGVYADLSDLDKPKFYSKCPECHHVHGFYNSLADAVLKKVCGACHFDSIEKLKRKLEKGYERPKPPKPGQKRKLPWPLSAVKENEEPLDWVPDVSDPDDSTGHVGGLPENVDAVLASEGFGKVAEVATYWTWDRSVETKSGLRRLDRVFRFKGSNKFTAQSNYFNDSVSTLRDIPEMRCGGSFRRNTAREVLDELHNVLIARNIDEAEELDWVPDPTDPDDSAKVGDVRVCHIQSHFDGDTMTYELFADGKSVLNFWSTNDAIDYVNEHGWIWKDGLVPSFSHIPRQESEEPLDWVPDPEDPDDSTSEHKVALASGLEALGFTLKPGGEVYVKHYPLELSAPTSGANDVEVSVRLISGLAGNVRFHVTLRTDGHYIETIHSSICKEQPKRTLNLVREADAAIQAVQSGAGFEHNYDVVYKLSTDFGLIHRKLGSVRESEEPLDWEPDPGDPDEATVQPTEGFYIYNSRDEKFPITWLQAEYLEKHGYIHKTEPETRFYAYKLHPLSDFVAVRLALGRADLLESEEQIDWVPDPSDPDDSTAAHIVDLAPALEKCGFVLRKGGVESVWDKHYPVSYGDDPNGFQVNDVRVAIVMLANKKWFGGAQGYKDDKYVQAFYTHNFCEDKQGVTHFAKNSDAVMAKAVARSSDGITLFKWVAECFSTVVRDDVFARDQSQTRLKESDDTDWTPDPSDPDDSTSAIKSVGFDAVTVIRNLGYHRSATDEGLWIRQVAVEGGHRLDYIRIYWGVHVGSFYGGWMEWAGPNVDGTRYQLDTYYKLDELLDLMDDASKKVVLQDGRFTRRIHVPESEEPLDWTPDPADPDDSTGALQEPLYWTCIATSQIFTGPYYCNRYGLQHPVADAPYEVRMSKEDALASAEFSADKYGKGAFTYDVKPAKDQSQMTSAGNRYPQDFWESAASVVDSLVEGDELDWEPDPSDPDDSMSPNQVDVEKLLEKNGFVHHATYEREWDKSYPVPYEREGIDTVKVMVVKRSADWNEAMTQINFFARGRLRGLCYTGEYNKDLEGLAHFIKNVDAGIARAQQSGTDMNGFVTEMHDIFIRGRSTYDYQRWERDRKARSESSRLLAAALLEDDTDWEPDPDDPDDSTVGVQDIDLRELKDFKLNAPYNGFVSNCMDVLDNFAYVSVIGRGGDAFKGSISLKPPWPGQTKVYYKTRHTDYQKLLGRLEKNLKKLRVEWLPKMKRGAELFQLVNPLLMNTTWGEYVDRVIAQEQLPEDFDQQTPETLERWKHHIAEYKRLQESEELDWTPDPSDPDDEASIPSGFDNSRYYSIMYMHNSGNTLTAEYRTFIPGDNLEAVVREAQANGVLPEYVKPARCAVLRSNRDAWKGQNPSVQENEEPLDWEPDHEDPDASTGPLLSTLVDMERELASIGFKRTGDRTLQISVDRMPYSAYPHAYQVVDMGGGTLKLKHFVQRTRGWTYELVQTFDVHTPEEMLALVREKIVPYIVESAAGLTETVTHSPEEIAKEAAKAEEPASEEHAEAGNYKKGHVSIQGLAISIENAKGSTRSGEDKSGKPWTVTLPAHYGYVAKVGGETGPRSRDKDHIDVYVGDKPSGLMVYVVNQCHLEGGFDEHKCMIGFESKDEATAVYDRAYSCGLGPKLRKSVVSTTMDKFKEWLRSGDTKKEFASVSESLANTILEM